MEIPRVAFPPKLRAVIYWGYFFAGVILGALAIVFGVYQAGTPRWLDAANQVFVYIGAAFGLTAATNVVISSKPVAAEPHSPEEVPGIHGVEPNLTDQTPQRKLPE